MPVAFLPQRLDVSFELLELGGDHLSNMD